MCGFDKYKPPKENKLRPPRPREEPGRIIENGPEDDTHAR